MALQFSCRKNDARRTTFESSFAMIKRHTIHIQISISPGANGLNIYDANLNVP